METVSAYYAKPILNTLRSTARQYFRLGGLVGLMMLISACGGGSGGGNSAPTIAAPSNLVARIESARSISLTWDFEGQAETFEVYRHTEENPDNSTKVHSLSSSSSYSHTDSGLTLGTSYYYWLKACDAEEVCSDFSGVASGRTALAIPSNLIASGESTRSISLSWSLEGQADIFEIYRRSEDDAQGVASEIVDRVAVSSPYQYIDEGLSLNSGYDYWLKACDAEEVCSDFSGVASGRTALAIPSNLIASGESTRSISLSWDFEGQAQSFQIYRHTGDNPDNSTKVGSVDSDSPPYQHTDSSLTPGTLYYYWLKTCDAEEACSDFSKTASDRTDLAIPSNLIASDESTRSISLSWDFEGQAERFEIYRHTGNNPEAAEKINEPVLDGSPYQYTDLGLTQNTPYNYWLKACDAEGVCSDFSGMASGRTELAAPSNLALSVESTRSISLTWDFEGQAERFEIYRHTGDNPEVAERISEPVSDGSDYNYTDSFELAANTQYYYWLKACDAERFCSDFSGQATTSTFKPIVGSISDLTATAKGAHQIELSWTVEGSVDSYKIYRNTQDTPVLLKKVVGSSINTSYIDPDLEANTRYYYWISGCRDERCDTLTSSVSAMTAEAAFSSFSAKPESADQITLSWNFKGEVDYFRIYHSTDNSAANRSVIASKHTASQGRQSYTDRGLTANTLYYYWFQACDSEDVCSELSQVLSAKTQVTNLSELKATVDSAHQITVSWVATHAVDHYLVYPSSDENPSSPIKVSSLNTSFTHQGLGASSRYFYWVRACDSENNCTGFSNPVDAKTLATAPTNLSFIADRINQISLSWELEGEVNYVQIYRDTQDIPTENKLVAEGNTYVDAGLDSNSQYTYWLKACNEDDNCSGFSSTLTATTQFEATGRLNDTGITIASNDGSDSDHGRDARAVTGTLVKKGAGRAGFDFTKMSQRGLPLVIQDRAWQDSGSEQEGSRWSCVLDNTTGLYWEVKSKDSDSVHNQNNTYLWGGITAEGKGHPREEGSYSDDWNSLVNTANSQKLCGFSDWRVPTLQELSGLVDRSQRGYALDNSYFPNGVADNYWTASADASNNQFAWYVNFNNFAAVAPAPEIYPQLPRDQKHPVRLVRSTNYEIVQPDNDFYIPNKTPDNRYQEVFGGYDDVVIDEVTGVKVCEGGNRLVYDRLFHINCKDVVRYQGAIIDKVTGLMWKVCSEGQRFEGFSNCTGNINSRSWGGALFLINKQSPYMDYQDWRLPNLKELQSIVAYHRINPSINTNRFSGVESDWYWSSTPFAGSDDEYPGVWAINFSNGLPGVLNSSSVNYSSSVNNSGDTGRVRLVRTHFE